MLISLILILVIWKYQTDQSRSAHVYTQAVVGTISASPQANSKLKPDQNIDSQAVRTDALPYENIVVKTNAEASTNLEENSFESRAATWLPRSIGFSGTAQSYRNIHEKFRLPDRYWRRLIDIHPSSLIHLSWRNSSDFREQVLNSTSSAPLIFQEGRYIKDIHSLEFKKDTMFCDFSLAIKEEGTERSSFDTQHDRFIGFIGKISVDRSTYQGFIGVSISLAEKESRRSISAIRCFAPATNANDERYKQMEVYHLLYSFKVSGF